MTQPRLTIGMATYDDFDGVYFTIQSLRMFHASAMPWCEFVVVDNHPESAHGAAVRQLLESVDGDVVDARYVAVPDARGPFAPKERVFREARADAVLCLDCHVMLWPGAVERLIDYYDRRPDCCDLLSGPLVTDNLRDLCTHLDDRWESEMWGAWACDERGFNLDAPPFDVPAQGAGLMSCRRDAWPGFHSQFRGFGGEEFYIHEKFRQAGAKCVCLPFLRWLHRFGRPSGRPFRLDRWERVRNFVIGHLELGLPLDRVRSHFVDSGLFPIEQWNALLADPLNAVPTAGDASASAPTVLS